MDRMRRWMTVFLIVTSSLLTTGCFDRQELEQQAFVTVLGVDKAPSNTIDCTLQIATPTASTNPEGQSKPPLAAKGPVTFRARNIPEALLLANTSVERSITLSHLNVVVFGEDLAKDGIEPTLQTFARYRQFRGTMFIAVAKGTAKDLISSNQPMLEKSPSRMADSIYVMGSRVGLFPITQLNNLITALENPHQNAMISLYAVNKKATDPQGNLDSNENYQAGDVARSGGNPVEWIGTALFRGDKMVATLNGSETLYLRMLRGTLKSTQVYFPAGDNSKENGDNIISLYIRKEGRPEIQVQLTNPPQVRVHLSFDADLMMEPSSDVTKDVISRQRFLQSVVEKQMETKVTELMDKIYKQNEIDPIPLSNGIRSQFRTFSEYANYPWEERLANLNTKVQVDVSIRRFGKRLEPIRKV